MNQDSSDGSKVAQTDHTGLESTKTHEETDHMTAVSFWNEDESGGMNSSKEDDENDLDLLNESDMSTIGRLENLSKNRNIEYDIQTPELLPDDHNDNFGLTRRTGCITDFFLREKSVKNETFQRDKWASYFG